MSIFDVIRDHQSRGDFEGAWQVGFQKLEQDISNTFLQTSLFWIIYKELKKVLEPIKTKDIKKPLTNEQRKIDHWASRIILLNLDLPNELIDFRLWNPFRDSGTFCDTICLLVLSCGSKVCSQADHEPCSTE